MARQLPGQRVRERRLAAGLKQADLAARAGVSPAYLNLIEHNRRALTPGVLERLAAALGLGVEALEDQGGTPLAEALRGVQAATTGQEVERAEDLARDFPGWAGLIVAQEARIEALTRAVASLNDRLSHDPHLSASLHEVLTAVASVRSTAGILAETPDLDDSWRDKFHANLQEDSERLARGAEALVDWLDGAGAAAVEGPLSPQEEVEAWAEAQGWALGRAGEAALSELASTVARDIAAEWCRRARADAQALPEPGFRAALAEHGPDPARIAGKMGGSVLVAMRRIALATGAGLVICDASGTPIFRKPVPGFALPRHGAACALWPLFTALARPGQAIEARVETLGAGGGRFLVRAISESRWPAGFGGPELREAAMLILPEPPGRTDGERLRIGAACRICPSADCPARREASILGGR